MACGDAKRAMGAAELLAALAPPAASVDAESHIEAARAAAEAHLAAGRLVDAHAGAARQFSAAQHAGLTHAALRVTLTLAETLLAAARGLLRTGT